MAIKMLKADRVGGALRLPGEIVTGLPRETEEMFVTKGSAGLMPYTNPAVVAAQNGGGQLRSVALPGYNLSNTGTNNVTKHGSFIYKGLQWDGLYVEVFNDDENPMEYEVIALTTPVYEDGLYNTAPEGSSDWQRVQYQGSDAGTVPGNSSLVFGPLYMPSIPLDEEPNWTVLALRTFAADETTAIGTQDATGTDLETQEFFACRQAGVNAVDDTELLDTPVFTTNMVNAVPIFITKEKYRNFAIIAGSAQSSLGDTVTLGHWWGAQNRLNDSGLKTIFKNYCVNTRSTADSLTLALSLIAAGGLDDIALLVSSGDDGSALLDQTTYLATKDAEWDVFFQASYAAGIRPWLITTTFATGYTNPQYATRIATNRAARVRAGRDPVTGVPNGTKVQCGLFDFGYKFSDESASVGTWRVLSNTVDGTHFSNSGHDNAEDFIMSVVRDPASLTIGG